MPSRSLNSVLQNFRQAVLRQESNGLSDGQLLEAFLSRHEEVAFAALVRRHGPMVFGVCRRVLGNRHDAEDAFQATFLVLLRKASSIRPRQAVGPWLHGVAQRTALRRRTARARRRTKERQAGQERRADPVPGEEDWRLLLDEELNRLPEKYRVPLVLCDLQGRTHKEAARELGWPLGTVSGRLWRGRDLLARRLTRRGLTLSAAVLGAAFAENAAFAGIASPLIRATMNLARTFLEAGMAKVAEEAASIAALTQGVLKAMWMTQLRRMAALVLAVSIGFGAALDAAGTKAKSEPREDSAASADSSARVPKAAEMPADALPTARELIQELNRNARLVRGLRCDVVLDCRIEKMTVGLSGQLACRRPRDVHVQAKILGQPALDLGCNEEAYWFAAIKMGPRRYWHVWRGFRREEIRNPQHWPVEYRPEWLLDVLGMAEYDPTRNYSQSVGKQGLEVEERVFSPLGEQLRKVLVFSKVGRKGGRVISILLTNLDGEVLVRADIRRVHTDEKTGARLTEQAVLSFPRERVEARLQFSNFRIDELSAEQAAGLFTTPWLKKSRPADDAKSASSSPAPIHIALNNTSLEMRRREEVMKLSGQPTGTTSLQVLNDQLRAWIEEDKGAAGLCITCEASVDYAVLKTILKACRQAGIRNIEVRTASE